MPCQIGTESNNARQERPKTFKSGTSFGLFLRRPHRKSIRHDDLTAKEMAARGKKGTDWVSDEGDQVRTQEGGPGLVQRRKGAV